MKIFQQTEIPIDPVPYIPTTPVEGWDMPIPPSEDISHHVVDDDRVRVAIGYAYKEGCMASIYVATCADEAVAAYVYEQYYNYFDMYDRVSGFDFPNQCCDRYEAYWKDDPNGGYGVAAFAQIGIFGVFIYVHQYTSIEDAKTEAEKWFNATYQLIPEEEETTEESGFVFSGIVDLIVDAMIITIVLTVVAKLAREVAYG